MPTIQVDSDERLQAIDITAAIDETLPAEGDGVATVFSRHTTAGITVNEAEQRLLGDLETALSELVADEGWDHDVLDGNADAHVRAMVIGASETIPVTGGQLALGRWQSVLMLECDGPRTRDVTIRFQPTG